jgi:hypothetical protein
VSGENLRLSTIFFRLRRNSTREMSSLILKKGFQSK